MRSSRLITVMAAVFSFGLALSAMALQTGEKAPDFKLNDQFGKTWDLSGLSGKVVVVVAANRDSGRAMGPWVDNLKKKYGDKIQLLGLMDLHTIPGIGRGIAKSRIRKETSDPLMLDFNGSTAKAYDVSSKVPVVVVVDSNAVIKAIQKNEYNADRFKSISNAVDSALK
ncbi:MAG: redoxin domain-containing protein [Armatimonadota bacterium]